MDKLSPEIESIPDIWKRFARHVVHYVLWLVSCALGLWLIFLLRWNLNDALFLRVNPWHLRAYDRWSIYVMGIVWIVCIFLIEGYLRQSLRSGRLHIAAGWIFSVLIGLIALSLGTCLLFWDGQFCLMRAFPFWTNG